MTHGACRRALLEDRMSEAARRHLAQCGPCGAFASGLTAVDSWRPTAPPPPAGLADRVVAQIRAQSAGDLPSPRRRSWRAQPRRFGPLAVGLSTAAVLALALGAGVALRGAHQSGAPGAPAASPRPIDPCATSAHCVVITVDLRGDAVVAGAERQPLDAPCASLAAITQTFHDKTTSGSFAFPLVHSVGGHQLFIGAGIQPYTGPGDYTSGIGVGSPLTFSIFGAITVDGRDYTAGVLTPTPRYATLGASVRANGSGAFSFAGLMNTRDLSRTIFGLVSWVCS